MRKWTVTVAGLAAVWALAAAVQAAPLSLKQVPANAKWLAHVDFDSMRGHVLAKHMRDEIMEKHKDAQARIDKFGAEMGMDVRNDLHGVTLYGTSFTPHQGVVIVNANVDQILLLKKAEKAPGHKVTKYGSYDLHSWTQDKERHGPPPNAAFFKPSILVFASSLDELKAALDVLGGKAASLGDKDNALAAPVPAGTTVVLRAANWPTCPASFRC